MTDLDFTSNNRSSRKGVGIVILLLSVLVSIVVTGVVVFMWQNLNLKLVEYRFQEQMNILQDSIEDCRMATNIYEANVKQVEESFGIKFGYNYSSPNWSKYIEDVEKKTGERMYSFSAPKFPSNDNEIFVSTSDVIMGSGFGEFTVYSKIYLYNIKIGDVTNFFNHEEEGHNALRTAGIDGNKLIFVAMSTDHSPNPCYSAWIDWDDIRYLDIENKEDGLHEYIVPDYQKEKALLEQNECITRLQNSVK